jgi:hypothetical protein
MTSLKDAWGEDDVPEVKSRAAAPVRHEQERGRNMPPQQLQQHMQMQPQMQHQMQHQMQPQMQMQHQMQPQMQMQHQMQPQMQHQMQPQMQHQMQHRVQMPDTNVGSESFRTVNLSPDEFSNMFGSKDKIFETAMSATHVMPDNKAGEPAHDTNTKQAESDTRLLNNINQMLGDTENFVIRKIADVQRTFASKTQKSIEDLAVAHQHQKVPFNWVGLTVLVLIVILFITLFVMQNCYFRRTLKALRALNIQRVQLDVLHPELTGL